MQLQTNRLIVITLIKEPSLKLNTMLEDYLYTRSWPPHVDGRFISLLVEAKETGLFHIAGNNNDAIVHVTNTLNREFGTSYTNAVCHEKLNLLRQRYRAFRLLLRKPGITFDPATNYVDGSPVLFLEVFEVRRKMFLSLINCSTSSKVLLV